MKKLSIKSRIFFSFTIFIIFIVNIFSVVLFWQTKKNIINENKKYILNEFETIKTFIDLQNTGIFLVPKVELEKINNMGFYLYVGNNDKNLQKKYKIGFFETQNSIIFRGDYKNYNIILGKELKDFFIFEQKFYEILIFLNLFLIFISFFISYFITKFSLKPLYKLSNFLNNYDFKAKNSLIKNNYGDTEIGILTDSINKFIKQNNEILESQKNFIQDVSHELKTPLMQIESNIELIEEKYNKILTEGFNPLKEKLEQIKKSTKDINEIISNLSFILRGEEVIKTKEKIKIGDYFENFIKKYKNLASKKNIKIKLIKNYDLIIENNKYYLDRLFGNLLSNAIFYNNGNGEIKIIIDKQKISIIDNGIGIENSELKKIFERFYRNKNSTMYYNSGNGLGLVIVKKIVDMFGWKIMVESRVGEGSRFEVIIK